MGEGNLAKYFAAASWAAATKERWPTRQVRSVQKLIQQRSEILYFTPHRKDHMHNASLTIVQTLHRLTERWNCRGGYQNAAPSRMPIQPTLNEMYGLQYLLHSMRKSLCYFKPAEADQLGNFTAHRDTVSQ